MADSDDDEDLHDDMTEDSDDDMTEDSDDDMTDSEDDEDLHDDMTEDSDDAMTQDSDDDDDLHDDVTEDSERDYFDASGSGWFKFRIKLWRALGYGEGHLIHEGFGHMWQTNMEIAINGWPVMHLQEFDNAESYSSC